MPPRNRILLEQRQRIIQAFEDVSEDYLTVAATIGVNRSTARSIVARYLREGRIAERPRGGANHVRVDDEMRNCLNDILNENCLLTLAQINQESRERLPRKLTIHDRTVARTLEGMLYHVKFARPLPVERNRPDVLQKRVDYANWFMRHAVVKELPYKIHLTIIWKECSFTFTLKTIPDDVTKIMGLLKGIVKTRPLVVKVVRFIIFYLLEKNISGKIFPTFCLTQ